MNRYILGGPDGRTPIQEPDLLKWARWFEDINNRRVAKTILADGEVEISTVFLGIDHGFGGGPPILFETMVFFPEAPITNKYLIARGVKDNYEDRWMERASTWEEAERMHAKGVAWARRELRRAKTLAERAAQLATQPPTKGEG